MWKAEEDGRTALLQGGGTAPGVLQEYAAEFLRLRAAASGRLQAIKDGQASRDELKAAEKAIDEMESNRRQVQVQLRLELSGTAGTARQEWDQRIQEWSKEVKSLRDELHGLTETQNRKQLQLSGTGSAGSSERRSAMQSTELMDRSSAKLKEAVAVALETEEVSHGVLGDLAQQRETILNVRNNTRTISTELSSARRSLDRMLALAQRHQTTTLAIAAVFGFGLAFYLLCYFGMPLKTTLILATVVFLLATVFFLVRRRLKTGSWQMPLGR